jgi:uncharacterized membrane protein YeaQ/YmgE (transglycosylase-associated protein family)
MADPAQTFTPATIQGILLAFMLGVTGQGIRVVVCLKKADEESAANAGSANGSRFLACLLIGAFAGALAAVPFLLELGSLGRQTIIAVIVAGLAGAFFIEALMGKALPGSGDSDKTPPPPKPPSPTTNQKKAPELLTRQTNEHACKTRT